MSFNIVILLLLVSACGVKGDPVAPKDRPLPSLLENYPDVQTDKNLEETKRR